jgi:hypothetical protein
VTDFRGKIRLISVGFSEYAIAAACIDVTAYGTA